MLSRIEHEKFFDLQTWSAFAFCVSRYLNINVLVRVYSPLSRLIVLHEIISTIKAFGAFNTIKG